MSLVKVKKYRNQKILDSAKGEPCTLRIPGVCNGDWTTTVWAHSPYEEDGHGTSTKSHDCFGCYACSACHDWLDGRSRTTATFELVRADKLIEDELIATEKKRFFNRAMKKSWLRLLQRGVLK